jgi:restriction endonuclease S subunit
MASEWPLMKLKAANVSLIDCDHRTPPAAKSGYPYVAIPQLQGGRIDLAGVRLITPEHFLEWTRKAKPTVYDVVLSRRCNPGETAYVSSELEFALGQNLVLLRSDGTKIYPPFLRWLVRSPEWWEQIDKFINVGAVFDSLKCADIPNFELHIPPLPEQHAIAGILGSLDDKIELNRRMNWTLESMARAVFRQWFVENEDVEIWEEINLGQFAYVIDCMHSKKPDREPEGKPLIQLCNILDDGLLDMSDTYLITEDSYNHWVSRIEGSPGDCVITNTGRVAAIAQIPDGYKAALGRNMTGIRCKEQYPFPTFLLECLLIFEK